MTKTAAKADYHTAKDIKLLLHEAEQALSHKADTAGDKIDELRLRLRSALESGRDTFEELRAETGRRARQADELVRENPYRAIGIAAGVGALLGIFLSRSWNGTR